MSLALSLNNALSGLRVNQQSIAVLSQNIANVNTAGYSRQILNQSAVVVGGVGSGVRIDDISRKVDVYLQRSVQTQGSNNALAATTDAYFQRIQALLGRPGSNNSIDSYVTSFFNSVQQLAETPETNSLKSNAIAAANKLASEISTLAANVHDLRYEADREISEAVSTVNSSLIRLRDINGALTQAVSLGQSTSELLDSRDRELRTLSQNLDISVTYGSAGTASVVAGDGTVLLEEGVSHRLVYSPASSVATFTSDSGLNALRVITLNDENEEIGNPVQLISGGVSSAVTTGLTAGRLVALQQIRDVRFNSVLDQLDSLASRLREGVNAIHNNGSGFPPATSLTGDREVRSGDQFNWSGQVRIAVLQSNGQPVPSPYADESYTGIRPLTLDLARLDSGQGNGRPTLQTIVDEINNHFGAPGNKARLGNLNNIQLASDTNVLPSGAPPLFNFDLDLENISSDFSRVFVTGITVTDDTAANITNVTQNAPSISILPSASYNTVIGTPNVTINLAAPLNVGVGDRIYLNPPSGPVNGIAPAALSGFVTVTAISGNSLTFTAGANATSTGAVNDPGNIQAFAPYGSVAAGFEVRTRDNGQLQVDFSGNPSSNFYDITVNVSVVDAAGTISSAPITYRVNNNERDIFNRRYDARAVGAPGTLVLPSSSQESLRAILVDERGVELPSINGKYIDGPAFLKLVGGNTGVSYGVAIDELDSQQLGLPDGSPAEAGTNFGFSHYFGLNNFFASNNLTRTGDSVKGSALNLRVQDRLLQNANLISTGGLSLQERSIASGNNDIYTYALYSGDNTVAQRLSRLNSDLLSFDSAGGLPATSQSLQGYSSQILGFISQRSAEASDNAANAKVLFDGFESRAQAESGVNLDEELANTITFQNAYAATARIITTVNQLYEDLLQIF